MLCGLWAVGVTSFTVFIMKHILTFSDAKFFPIVRRFAYHANRFLGYTVSVYDLGLDDRQKKILTDSGVNVLWTEFPEDALGANDRGQIRTSHKMYCIEHFIRANNTSILILDADTLIIENIDELWPKESDGIVVTARCPREHAPHLLINGMINAGVMAFGADTPSEFFAYWKERCLRDANATDQSALSDMLAAENVDFRTFDVNQSCRWGSVIVRDGETYNDVTCRTGKIFHFKSIARRGKKLLTYKLFSLLYAVVPCVVEGLVRYNRKHRIVVWKKKECPRGIL